MISERLAYLRLQNEDAADYYEIEQCLQMWCSTIKENYSLSALSGQSNHPVIRKTLQRNQMLREKVKRVIRLLILAKKLDKDCDLQMLQIDIIKKICR